MRSKPFIGFIDEMGKIRWDFPSQVRAFMQTLVNCEVEVEIREKRKKRTLDQNAGFHAMLTPWARDEGHNITELKRDLLGEVFGWSDKISPLSANRTPMIAHTSELSVAQFSELIERTLEIAAGCGYVLEAPNEYRERKEKARRAAAKALAKEHARATAAA